MKIILHVSEFAEFVPNITFGRVIHYLRTRWKIIRRVMRGKNSFCKNSSSQFNSFVM